MDIEQQPETQPRAIVGQPAELHGVLHIKRAATGLTETVHFVGRTTVEQAQAAGIQPQPTPEA